MSRIQTIKTPTHYAAVSQAFMWAPSDLQVLTQELIVRKRKMTEVADTLQLKVHRSTKRNAEIFRLLAQVNRLQLEVEEHLGNYIQGGGAWSREQLVLTGEQQDAVIEEMCVLCYSR